MSTKSSPFVWYDIMTTDVEAAGKFYSDVVGWQIADSRMPDGVYKIFSAGSHNVAGLMPVPEEMGNDAAPVWFGYIGVSDVDDYAGRVKEAGGEIHRAPTDIPGVGRFAIAADPHGATFILFAPNSDEQPAEISGKLPGHVAWHDLQAGDLDEAWNFYAKLFGWSKSEAMDMGPMGTYQMFATGAEMVGGIMTKMPDTPKPHWLYYFRVEAIEAAMKRVTEGGGVAPKEPHEVPGGEWIAQCTDPQGAQFGMVAPAR